MANEQDTKKANNDIRIEDLISERKQKDYKVPAWSELKKEYYPEEHDVMNTAAYPNKVSKNGTQIKVTRATRGLQRRAVKIMTGMMFGIPVKRVYSEKSEDEKKAAAIIEQIYKANRIDTVNIQRGIQYFASCEVATLWYALKQENNLYGEKSSLKIKCRTFSPMEDENIYPLFDDNGDLTTLSFEYNRHEDGKQVQYFDSYTEIDHHKWRNAGDGWEVVEQEGIEGISKIPAVFANRKTPIWENSNNVTEMEWVISRNGNYLRRNSVPVFTISEDENITFKNESDDDERVILQLSSKAKAGYQTWEQAIESLRFQVETLERSFFSDIQIPNFSDYELKGGGSSGESKRYWFVEAIIKVLEEKGAWVELFSREFSVIKAFAKLAFPNLANAFDSLTVEHIITPFELSNEKDTINNISTAVSGGISSKRTGINRLGWVKDIDEEMKQIESDNVVDFTEPTE